MLSCFNIDTAVIYVPQILNFCFINLMGTAHDTAHDTARDTAHDTAHDTTHDTEQYTFFTAAVFSGKE